MPAYNEEEGIAGSVIELTRNLDRICKDYEIIVADDGSTDRTRETVETIADERVRLVGYRRNQGKGHALKHAFSSVTGQFTFLVDSDSDIRPVDLEAFVSSLQSADFAIGSKRHPNSSVQAPIVRKFLSIGFNILERFLTGIKTTDTQSGLKAAKSVALYRILPLLSVKRYAFDAELLTVAGLLGFRIRELPVHINLKAMFSVRQVFRMLIDLLGIAYRLRIKRWYQQNMLRMSETYKPIIPW